MSVTLTYRPAGDVMIVDVVGRVVMGDGSATLRDGVKKLLQEGKKQIILNMAEVTYIDNYGIGELVSCFTNVSNEGGSLKLLNLTKRVQDLLMICKLYTIFEVFIVEAEAVSSFNK